VTDLVEVRDLSIEFQSRGLTIRALDRVSFRIAPGTTLALVGESGSGKSITAQAMMRILPPSASITSGQIVFTQPDGRERPVDIVRLAPDGRKIRRIRGRHISMIFQEPMVSLSPLHTIGDQVSEALFLHHRIGHREGMARTEDMLRRVGFPDPRRALRTYPFQLSGGLRQRAMIAMALVCRPSLLIADEPTTALDVTIQAQILDLMRELKQKTGAAIVLITHDLGVVAEMAERVVVMYAGRKVEEAAVADLFARPRHPYTRGLLDSIPKLAAFGGVNASASRRRKRLAEIAGTVPSLSEPIIGCAFAPRCGFATVRCRTESPPLEEKATAHFAACWESDRLVAMHE
jgi:peptide/nickel transport system ATP-binding protein